MDTRCLKFHRLYSFLIFWMFSLRFKYIFGIYTFYTIKCDYCHVLDIVSCVTKIEKSEKNHFFTILKLFCYLCFLMNNALFAYFNNQHKLTRGITNIQNYVEKIEKIEVKQDGTLDLRKSHSFCFFDILVSLATHELEISYKIFIIYTDIYLLKQLTRIFLSILDIKI